MSEDVRMGAFDAVMWGVEDDPMLRSVIVALLVLDDEPDLAVLRERTEVLTRQVPQLRQRVIGNPFSLVPPRWETDPDYDLDYHLRVIALPKKGNTLDDVLRLAERTAEQDFDRDRPLWEFTIITGLKHGGAAAIMKIHHAITDGVGGMMLAATLLDLTPEPRTDLGEIPEPPRPHPALDPLKRLADGMEYQVQEGAGLVAGVMRGGGDMVRRLVSDPTGSVASAVDFTASAGRLLAPASTPLSPIMTGRSLSTRYAILDAPLAALKAAGKASGGTLNDAFLTVVARGLRIYHESLGAEVEGLRVNMPVNLRTDGTPVRGNAWVPARFVLPLQDTDPKSEMAALHPLLKQVRSEPALPISTAVYRVMCTLPTPVATAVAGGLMKGTDLAATNVPGPPFPVYLAGARVSLLVPFAPRAGAAINIALMSYDGTANIGLSIDPVAVTDIDLLLRSLAQALDDVIAVA